MEKFKTFMNDKRLLVAPVLGSLGAVALPVFSNASGGESNVETSVATVLDEAFQGIQTDATSYITSALPYALGIMALVLGITIAVKAFKRFSK